LPVFISLLFSTVAYWLVNFRGGAEPFFLFVMWHFLDLLAAESLVVLISSIFPNFVISLTLTAFANGLWMCVGGFLVSPTILNVFWRYVFHYIDYQVSYKRMLLVNSREGRRSFKYRANTRFTGICLPGLDGQRVLGAAI
jgi:hypothetical protein